MPGVTRIHVAEGESRVSAAEDACLVTLLGSCVAACLYDPAVGAGGMCHFLLPGEGEAAFRAGAAERYGAFLMEVLVNGLLEHGARRDRLRAKLFGGAATLGLGDTGRRNGDFAKRFLETERVPLMATSLGGTVGRRVEFWPASGRARQLYLDAPPPPAATPPPLAPDVGAVEFF